MIQLDTANLALLHRVTTLHAIYAGVLDEEQGELLWELTTRALQDDSPVASADEWDAVLRAHEALVETVKQRAEVSA